MKSWKIDVPVLLIFFIREEPLKKVFESIREARPSELLLWQDGPREGREDDIIAIQKCREIVEQIDWDCKVYKMYNEKNYGCDPSTFLAHKWAFSNVNKCIILEDDRIPVQSFFYYCKELLDKYEFDERINHICGTNLLGIYEECQSDYFFAYEGSTTWATWKRVADSWDDSYKFLKDQYSMKCLNNNLGKNQFKIRFNNAVRHCETGQAYWETILGFDALLNSRLVIIPKQNMVCDIGLTENATHAQANEHCIPKTLRKVFNMETYEITAPIKHPNYIVVDTMYSQKINKIFGTGYFHIRLWLMIQQFFLYIRYGEYKRIFASIKRRLELIRKV